MMTSEPEKLALISGGTRGLGRALSSCLGAAGYEVVALYAKDEEAAAATQAALRDAGVVGRVLRHDVAGDRPLELELELGLEREILLVNNACSPVGLAPLHLVKWDDVLRQIEVNVAGSMRLAQSVLRSMVQRGSGTIVSVLSSVVGARPPKGMAAYGVAKHGLLGLSRALATEYHSRGVRVFSVSPGFMDTELTATWPSEIREELRRRGAVEPEAVAAFLLRLVGDGGTPGRGEDYPFPSSDG